MLRFILSRIGMAVPTVFLVAVVVFFLIRLVPGDPAALLLGDMASPESVAALRSDLGLDKNILTQFEGPIAEKCGLLKMDFLGLRTLTTLQRSIDLVTQTFAAQVG